MKRGLLLGRRNSQRFRLLSISAVGLVMTKLFLSLCVTFTLLLTREWRQQESTFFPSSPPPLGTGYSILINTWKRNDLLKHSIFHYASCEGVDSFHIVWSETDPPPASLHDYLRFKEIKDLRTEAIFSVDDDVIFPCNSVEFAFSVWRSAPARMVGFVPRMHWLDKLRDNKQTYKYGGWWSVWWMGTYSMVLSKAAFFHKNYLDLYTNHMPGSIRDFVTRNRNCEDIAMSFLVANRTGAPPIWVKGRAHELGLSGISSERGHNERRSHCLNVFAALYGHMPLIASSMKAIDSRYSWFW